MKVEVWAALVGASVAVAGAMMVGGVQKTGDTRDEVIRLITAVENISGQLESMSTQMREDRMAILKTLSEHSERITVLETRGQ